MNSVVLKNFMRLFFFHFRAWRFRRFAPYWRSGHPPKRKASSPRWCLQVIIILIHDTESHCTLTMITLYTGAQIGNILSNFLSGFIMRYIPGGWPNVFYFFGIVSIIWFILWCIFVYNDPNSHPFISDEERAYLKKSIGRLERKKVLTIF